MESRITQLTSGDKVDLISVLRKEIIIGEKTVSAFMDAQGKYYLNVYQVENLIELGRYSFLTYLTETRAASTDHVLRENAGFKNVKELRAAWAKGLISDHGVFSVETETGQIYRALELDLVTDFILDQAYKRNSIAQTLAKALTKESLQIRCEASFIGVSPNILSIQQQTNNWLLSRKIVETTQPVFQQSCVHNKYPANHVHDYLTSLVFGQTAQQAILNNPLVGDDENCGLDHQQEAEKLELVAHMKMKFAGYRSGSYKEKLDRAYKECCLEKKKL